MTQKPEYAYIVFSATDCAIGRFIRWMTRYQYNHVSLSLDPAMSRLYSFARYYECAPFYAGFVEESFMRYQLDGKPANIKICRIPLSDSQADMLKTSIASMCAERGQYIYNYLSAACFLIHHKVNIPFANTCVDFVTGLLSSAKVEGIPGGYTSIRNLEASLDKNTIYEGEASGYSRASAWGNDMYEFALSRRKYVLRTIKLLGRLFYRAVARFV